MPYSVLASKSVAYTGTAGEIAMTMDGVRQYRLTVTTDAWVRITTAGGTAAVAAADDNVFLKGGESLLVCATAAGNRISAVQASAGGTACLTQLAGP